MSVFKKWILPALLAGVLLAGCGGDDGGNVSALRKESASGAQPQAPAPTPQPATVEQVEKVITQWATVIVRETVVVPQRVEVPVEVDRVVVVTPTPDVQGFAAQPAQYAQPSGVTGYADASCDTSQPQPAIQGGGVDRVIGCVDAWNQVYGGQP